MSTIIFLLSLVLSTLASAVTISPPKGPYGIASSTMELVDQSRRDPFAPGQEPRRLMLSIFQPAPRSEPCHLHQNPYMPPATAAAYDEMYSAFGMPNGTFASFDIEYCRKSQWNSGKSYPVVIFSPGLGNSRLLYSAMATSLSSQGFVVVTVDHPYDASIVEYPDGSTVLAVKISSEAQIVKALEARQQDITFVVDQILTTSSRFHKVIRTNQIFAYGHSLGGATAAAAMMNDRRISGGVNLDGEFFDPFIKPGLDCPFMLVGRENKTIDANDNWAKMWQQLRSTKVDLEIDGFVHGTFTDLQLLVEALGLNVMLPAEASELLGSVDRSGAVGIVTAYVSSFFRFAIGRARASLEMGLEMKYPEVSVPEVVRRGRRCNH